MKGYIHSKESFGTVDGPGIRYVLFMQGCPMRCLYCHNPDTWNTHGGDETSAEDVISEMENNIAFYRKGGITVSGGEPLLQIDFVTELFMLAKKKNIHTCIDTSGITYSKTNEEYLKKLDRLMEYTDLVLLDIKHIHSEEHKALTGRENENILEFAKYLEEKKIPIWVRHVIVRGYTDKEEDLFSLGEFIGSLSNLQGLDVLPYHNMGKAKYSELGIPYPLGDLAPTTKQEADRAREKILEGIRKTRAKRKG